MKKKAAAGPEAIVPAIVLLFLVFFLVYIFWIESSERARLLGLRDDEPETSPNLLLDQEIGYVGKGLSGAIDEHTFDDFTISYPKSTNNIASEDKNLLQTWVFGKGMSIYDYSKTTEISSISISFDVEDVKGVPNLNILLNGESLYTSTATKDSVVAVEIPYSELADSNKINIECVFNSWNIFETQSCLLSQLEIKEVMFEKGEESHELNLEISPVESDAGTARISFDVDELDTSGNLIIKVNSITMFKGKPIEELNSKEKGWDTLGLQEGTNTITFEAEKGGYYKISDVKFESLATKEEATSVGPYQFYINGEVYNEATLFKIQFFAEEITPGDVVFVVGGSSAVPYTFCPSGMEGCSHINSNMWNTILVSKEDVITGINTLSISSESGRYKISSLKVVWE